MPRKKAVSKSPATDALSLALEPVIRSVVDQRIAQLAHALLRSIGQPVHIEPASTTDQAPPEPASSVQAARPTNGTRKHANGGTATVPAAGE